MIRSKKDLQHYLQLDRQVNAPGRFCFRNPIYQFLRLLRHLEYYQNKPSYFHKVMMVITKLRFRRLSLKLGFSIPPNVFGPGLSIPHYGTIVVNAQARIGAYCRLHAGVNIGASAGKPEGPRIGDHCYIGPGAIIFGAISIADNVTIGANSTVNKDCATEHCVLAGSPAKIVRTDAPNWLQFNKVQH